MKRKLLAILLISSSASAQEMPVQKDDIMNQYLIETGQCRMALGTVKQELAKLRRELEQAKAASEKKEK